jgi:hypothetical protein
VLAAGKTALVIEDRFAGVNLFAAAFSFDHRVDKAFKFFTRPAINAEPMRKAIRSAAFPAQILHLSRHVGIAPIIKGKQAAKKRQRSHYSLVSKRMRNHGTLFMRGDPVRDRTKRP